MESKIINQYESTSTYRVFDVEVDGKRYTYEEFQVHENNKDNNVEFSIQDENGKFVADREILQAVFDIVDKR
jgi:hypothetical protein